ncbi:BAAT/Acyl-CoA thioester hydrolase [Clostridium sp. DL-VIII]|uniref:acyl-CoA thioester hydrolase/BAAT C-terminal domain-containing protein n=1 Tax=Clostridium sp. DL-VIII TaxID=641107 RepID=UPI00023AFD53|nr:acyl-CoA thioester hydrolase/BAAT C-terminal domain-containing protein [Clostridium sp. DL-VIII]EHI98970.1 BAAT/Acyl-CoA thioester hydrolase [Clostridium sp. DL-VIII]
MEQYRSKEIYADFYENKGKRLAVIMGGSVPGLPSNISNDLSNYLKQNFNILLLAYYGVGELTKSLEMVPIEYFTNSINFIKEKYNIPDNEVIIIGQSKGGEAALVLTNYMKSVITIACVPSSYVFQGLPEDLFSILKAQPKASWSFSNKELPYIKFNIDEEAMNNAKNNNFCRCYETSIENNFNPDAVITIDSYKGKILLISSENDSYWPSKNMCNTLVKNSKNNNNIKHVSLNLEGHSFLKYDESVREIISYLKSTVQ